MHRVPEIVAFVRKITGDYYGRYKEGRIVRWIDGALDWHFSSLWRFFNSFFLTYLFSLLAFLGSGVDGVFLVEVFSFGGGFVFDLHSFLASKRLDGYP